jgi:hypothetical protein
LPDQNSKPYILNYSQEQQAEQIGFDYESHLFLINLIESLNCASKNLSNADFKRTGNC